MIIPTLRDLLGHGVLLLGWPKGSKGLPKKWGHLTVADMTVKYLRSLERGNIGVALGEKSGNLVAIDIDDDALVNPFIAQNPFLKDTLQTHGARGRVFWLRMAGQYPTKTVKLKTRSGEDAGEFRSNGSQSIIHGIHPKGHPYSILNPVKPLSVDFASISWPTCIANPPALSYELGGAINEVIQRDRETELQSNGATEVTEVTDVVCVGASLVRSVEEAVRLSLPDAIHQNNNRLFLLARAVKSLELTQGKFSPDQLRSVFASWYSQATCFLRTDQTRDEYMMEFMNAYASARIPLGEGTITQAWKAAQAKPLPPEAMAIFDDEQPRRIVALCRELQILAGAEPFYLSARTLARLLNQDTHATAARWLKSLCVQGLIDEVSRGSGTIASRYRYNGTLE